MHRPHLQPRWNARQDLPEGRPLTYLEWDLKNDRNVPIAGGVHIIHVDAPGVGEKIVKWFAVMRPVDLENF